MEARADDAEVLEDELEHVEQVAREAAAALRGRGRGRGRAGARVRVRARG